MNQKESMTWCLLGTTGKHHIWINSGCNSPHKTCKSPRQTRSDMKKGKRHILLPVAEEVLKILSARR